ncbi:MAG: ATP-binding protein [Desulfobacterales bacterium]|nr:ATP-binding protein [Desulfobacterales bacterium]
MFLKRLTALSRSLAFRLTLWYAGIFALSSCLAFVFFYYLVIDVLREQTDDNLRRQLAAFSGIMQVDGITGVQQVAAMDALSGGDKKRLIRLLSRFGTQFSVGGRDYWQDVGVNAEAIRDLLTSGAPVIETVVLGERKDSLRIIYGVIGPGVIMQLGHSLAEEIRLINAFQRLFLTTIGIFCLLAAAIGWFLARRALSGVGGIAAAARKISGGDLQTRAPISGRQDEIDQLAGTLNHMLDRIQTLVRGIGEMSDNIAHDLKSPVTRIRGLAEITLTTAQTDDDYQNMAANTIEECDRLLEMINAMLFISRTEAGVREVRPEAVDLNALVGDAVQLFETTAVDKHLALSFEAGPHARIRGDARMLQRMIANLLDNAIRYTPAGGQVTVTLHGAANDRVQVDFSDTGIGIAEDDRERIFERFYRCDPSRSESGSGLGLSLARAVARAHGGDITVKSTLGEGSIFSVRLPLVPDSQIEKDLSSTGK